MADDLLANRPYLFRLLGSNRWAAMERAQIGKSIALVGEVGSPLVR